MIYGDNEGAVALTKNDCYHARTKYIDIRYHYVQEQVEENSVKVDVVRAEGTVRIWTKTNIFTCCQSRRHC